MCEWKKHGDTRIDPCMKHIIHLINGFTHLEVVSSCCGHLKYPMTIVVKFDENYWEVFTDIMIPRTKRFYKKDKQGYYYIPEVIK